MIFVLLDCSMQSEQVLRSHVSLIKPLIERGISVPQTKVYCGDKMISGKVSTEFINNNIMLYF